MKLFKQRIIGDKQRIKQLRLMLSVFFICLVIPLALMIYFGFQQFKDDVNYQYQLKSVNVLKQINKKLNSRVKTERKRPISHYNFYQEVTNPLTGEVSKELSPLANPNSYLESIGLIGFFQINTDKTLSSPLLPYHTKNQLAQANTNLKWHEIERRIAIKKKLRNILINNNFMIKNDDVLPKPAEPENKALNSIKTESFQVKITDQNELILFRNIWLNQQHKIQGFIVNKDIFLQQLFIDVFAQGHFESNVQMRLKVIHSEKRPHQYLMYSKDKQGNTEVTEQTEPSFDLATSYIYHGYVIAPFQKIQLMFTTNDYPLDKASALIILCVIVLVGVIILGCLGFYWLGIKQIKLAEQRMNFVSSVSHELKTPLTSILMYSEMLKSGMVQNPTTQLEYHEFIFGESSRLSRLISNILKLSHLNRQQEVVNVEYVNIETLKDTIQSKTSSLIEKNAFNINFYQDEKISYDTKMLIDLDAFSQIAINLVDNAIKFFNAAKIDEINLKKIDMSFSFDKTSNKNIIFSIRDYGPGIANSEIDRIFELFYRQGNEMTRTTPGTGIGLALVNELVIAQGGFIKVKRMEPGVAFNMYFKYKNYV